MDFSRYLGQHNLIGGAIPKIVDCMEQILDGMALDRELTSVSPGFVFGGLRSWDVRSGNYALEVNGAFMRCQATQWRNK
jgi:hypothetical protein